MNATPSSSELWQSSAPFFLYVSRIEHPGKNHLRLIEAFNQFKATTGSPWQLALAGGDWHGASVVHEAALNSPFANDISFLGFTVYKRDTAYKEVLKGLDARELEGETVFDQLFGNLSTAQPRRR